MNAADINKLESVLREQPFEILLKLYRQYVIGPDQYPAAGILKEEMIQELLYVDTCRKGSDTAGDSDVTSAHTS